MSKKKIFIQGSPVFWVPTALFVAIMAAAVYIIINVLHDAFYIGLKNVGVLYWIGFVAALCAIVYFGRFIIGSAFNRIIFDDLELCATGCIGRKSRKLQDEAHIGYDEITNIYMTSSTEGRIDISGKNFLTAMPYIAFECADGRVKAINVLYFTGGQIVKIIDGSVERVNALGGARLDIDGKELLSEFRARRKKRKAE